MNFLDCYLSRTEFDSYEDFVENFKINVPDNFNFAYDIVDEYAKLQPDKKAMVWCNEAGDEKTFNFADISELSNQVANFLTSIGIKKGDPVMLMLKRRHEFWSCLVALHKIGAVAIPATHMLTSHDIVYRNNAADIKMIITVDDPHIMAAVDEAEKDSPTLKFKAAIRSDIEGWFDLHKEMSKASTDFPRPTGDKASHNDDMLILWFTSGTTGMPKMVHLDYTYPLGHILTAKYWQNVIDDGLHLTIADTGWAKAGWGKIYGQWISGSAIFTYDFDHKFEPHRLLESIHNHKVTTFCAPATAYRMMIKEGIEGYDLSSLQYCVVAGEPLYPEVFKIVHDAFGLRLMEGFGQTETTVAIANYPWMTPKPGSMGKPSPGYNVDLVNDEGVSCKVGEHGHIVYRICDECKPVGMFRGYYRDQELTDHTWNNGTYFTGDIAYKDEDGHFWYVTRADDSIKSSGYRIGPFEVESALQEHPAVLESAVTGVPDPVRGQVVKANVVLNKGFVGDEAMIIELQNHVKEYTAPYKYPRVIEFVDQIPKTISGKIIRKDIRATDHDRRVEAGKE